MQKQNWFNVDEISDRIFMITEGDRYKSYLLLGEKRSLLIDCGLGVGDIKRLVKSMTDTDVEVALTHGHWDHIGGACYFGTVGIHPADKELAVRELHPKMQERAQKFLKDWSDQGYLFPPDFSTQDYKIRPCDISHDLNHSDNIDIGGVMITAYHTPGHSPGSISYLEEATGILFAGDAVKPANPQFAHLPGSDLESYARSMELLASVKDKIKMICSGHTEPFYDSSILDEMAEGFRGAVNGKYLPQELVDDDWGKLKEFSFERFSIWIR